MTEMQYEALEAELDDINYSTEAWTEADIARHAEIIAILDEAGRL